MRRGVFLLVLLSLGGCPSFDDFTGGDAAAPSAPDGGIAADSGAATIARCGTNGLLLCEDFENGPSAAWSLDATANAAAVADTTRAFRGTKALHLRTSAQPGNAADPPRAAIRRTNAALPPAFFVRLFVFLSGPPMASDKNDVLLGSLVHGQPDYPGVDLAAKHTASSERRPGIDAWASGLHVASARPFPLDAWTCVEWSITPSGVSVAMDGVAVTDLSQTVTVPSIDQQSFGLMFGREDPMPSFAAYEAWIDELLIGTSPIGCNVFASP